MPCQTGMYTLLSGVRSVWSTVQVRVKDSGPGIPNHVRDHIFDFNYSGAQRTNNKLGFGLWWVRTIMARCGGKIWVEDDDSLGTSFRLSLHVEGSL